MLGVISAFVSMFLGERQPTEKEVKTDWYNNAINDLRRTGYVKQATFLQNNIDQLAERTGRWKEEGDKKIDNWRYNDEAMQNVLNSFASTYLTNQEKFREFIKQKYAIDPSNLVQSTKIQNDRLALWEGLWGKNFFEVRAHYNGDDWKGPGFIDEVDVDYLQGAIKQYLDSTAYESIGAYLQTPMKDGMVVANNIRTIAEAVLETSSRVFYVTNVKFFSLFDSSNEGVGYVRLPSTNEHFTDVSAFTSSTAPRNKLSVR